MTISLFTQRRRRLAVAVAFLFTTITAIPGFACDNGPDSDNDEVCDDFDNCLGLSNPTQTDTDLDGYGNACDGDINADGAVNGLDAVSLIRSFNQIDPATRYDVRLDADESGDVSTADAQIFIQQYLRGLPGPSGLPCAGSPPCSGDLETPSQTEHVLNRLTYGPTPALRAAIDTQGVVGFIQSQLSPAGITNSALDAQIAALPTLSLDIAELRDQFAVANARRPLTELTTARIIRNLTSLRQLEEQLVDFWLNHFNVFGAAGATRQTIVPYERDAIRPHVLGRFADLVIASARAPAMLDYLDNRVNRAGSLNENYARELLELHTLSVDAGYTQQDVVEVARTLTGWGIDFSLADGFAFRPRQHDDGAKSILGSIEIAAGAGEAGGIALLEALAVRPETAEFISRKLVRRFVSDAPPERLVNAAAETFTATGGDLRAVMETILLSPEFLDDIDTRGTKYKRPAVLIASLARALAANPLDVASTVLSRMRVLGEEPYLARPPTGYPDSSEFWASPGALVTALNAIDRAARSLDGYDVEYDIAEGATAFRIVDELNAQLFPARVSAATRNAALLLAHDLRRRPHDRRVEQVAAFLLSSPEFLLH